MTPTVQEVAKKVLVEITQREGLEPSFLTSPIGIITYAVIVEALTTFATQQVAAHHQTCSHCQDMQAHTALEVRKAERAVWENLNLCDECRRKNVPEDHH